MSKYDFIGMGQKVWYDPFNDNNCRLMQVCTKVPEIIKNDTRISLIPVDSDAYEEELSCEYARADELKPYLNDFSKGYWCAVQNAVANGASDTTVSDMIKAAGFSYNECIYLMEDSDFQSDKLSDIVETTFPMTLGRLVDSLEFEPQFLMLELSNGDVIRGIVIDEHIDHKRDTFGRYIYDVRHSDDTDALATLENIVRVNRECTIAVDKPIEELENGEYLEIVDWSHESWEEAAENVLLEEVDLAATADIQTFISDYWENLETFERNIATFKQWIGQEIP